MTIQRSFSVLLVTLGACGGGSPPSTATQPGASRQLEVRFTDYNRNGTLADHGAATAYLYDDAVKIVLRSGVFPFVPTASLRLVALSAGLAFGDTAGRWDRARESPKVFVGDISTRADTLADSVTFWIRNTRGIDLSKHWLMLTEYAQFYVRERGAWAEANRPIHGDLAMFRSAGIVGAPPNER